MSLSVAERFWAKVDLSAGLDACHPWTAGVFTTTGYGSFWPGGPIPVGAHQWVYEEAHGPIPLGPNGKKFPLDHTCHNEAAERSECPGGLACLHRRCCNEGHLVLSTLGRNVLSSPLTRVAINAAKTHCVRGHPLSGDNLYVTPDGRRNCKACLHSAVLRYRRKATT